MNNESSHHPDKPSELSPNYPAVPPRRKTGVYVGMFAIVVIAALVIYGVSMSPSPRDDETSQTTGANRPSPAAADKTGAGSTTQPTR